ncbi:tripartite motif-containing 7-like isoform X2 [Chlorella sorokiniana]|uniref:RING-type E3 ubiquitin transferase n=1 Tax=Chlorella sorokiniana TaxID=3076 RepID=A0A2P6TL01_CHLSO|nr:tripartite motif-containing 7-like isoform X2 [Chlorella sorokiniana]|eukprot:PRW44972.1 tripartite motif-containing 7-like isoform X2 [Chlorella sorokiniana]
MDNCENQPAFANTPGVACASSGGCPSLPEDLLTRIREELTCAICFDVATRPATLPCGHSACRRCLNAAVAVAVPADKRRCPVCRAQLPIGLPPLAINSTLKNIAELLLPEECKERAGTTPEEERRPQEWMQRVLLCTRGRAVSLHTTHEINAQAHRSAVAGLNALLGVMEERWPEARQRPPARSPAPAAAPAPARSPAPAAAAAPAGSPAPARSPAPAVQPAHRATPRTARQPAVPGSQQRVEQPRWRSAAARDPPPARNDARGDRTPAAARRLAEFASPQAGQPMPAGQPEAPLDVQPAAFPDVLPSPEAAGAAPQPLLTTANRQGVVPSPPLLLRTARQAAIAELAEQLGMMRLGGLGGLVEAAAPPAEQAQQEVPAAEGGG